MRHLLRFAGLVLFAAGWVLWVYLPGDRLLSRATCLAPTDRWELNRFTYCWLSADTVLYFREDPRNGDEAICRVDVRTMRDTPLTALTRLTSQGGQELGPHSDWSVSPDGRWLLWNSWGTYTAHAAMLDGTRHRQ